MTAFVAKAYSPLHMWDRWFSRLCRHSTQHNTTQQLHSCKGGLLLFTGATSLSLSLSHYLHFSLYLYSLFFFSFLNIFITLFFRLRCSLRTINHAILSHFHQCTSTSMAGNRGNYSVLLLVITN